MGVRMTSRVPNIAAAGAKAGVSSNGQEVLVGLAEIRVAKGPANFAFIGLGSCIGFCALDPVADIAGAAHIMLPRASGSVGTGQLGKFADTAVGELIRLMEESGASREQIVAAYAGGANLTEAEGASARFDTGKRNIEALSAVIDSLEVAVMAANAGGTAGRSLRMCAATGDVTVRTIKAGEQFLCRLRS